MHPHSTRDRGPARAASDARRKQIAGQWIEIETHIRHSALSPFLSLKLGWVPAGDLTPRLSRGVSPTSGLLPQGNFCRRGTSKESQVVARPELNVQDWWWLKRSRWVSRGVEVCEFNLRHRGRALPNLLVLTSSRPAAPAPAWLGPGSTTSFRNKNGEGAPCPRRVSASRFNSAPLSSDHFSSRMRCSTRTGPRSLVTCGRLSWMADGYAMLRIASAMTSRLQRASGPARGLPSGRAGMTAYIASA